jgi:hypothetical protein
LLDYWKKAGAKYKNETSNFKPETKGLLFKYLKVYTKAIYD